MILQYTVVHIYDAIHTLCVKLYQINKRERKKIYYERRLKFPVQFTPELQASPDARQLTVHAVLALG